MQNRKKNSPLPLPPPPPKKIWLLGPDLKKTMLDQAYARTPYTTPFWGLSAYHTPRHDFGCPTPCKIIILQDKMITQQIF